ncbi:hypothetical protein TIFTF001_029410 [Ficus carica]|uniref:Uncharacterized protein n=1 Tax=Ficus carica TaxID=3494 RepID=A0AA88DSE8_FICCA|nr:hypothetical protein TIFTF001_029410 [Ficus carica]
MCHESKSRTGVGFQDQCWVSEQEPKLSFRIEGSYEGRGQLSRLGSGSAFWTKPGVGVWFQDGSQGQVSRLGLRLGFETRVEVKFWYRGCIAVLVSGSSLGIGVGLVFMTGLDFEIGIGVRVRIGVGFRDRA